MKNDYVTNASLTSRLNDLKSQHIATEVKTIDDKAKKNASDILSFESRLKQKEDIVTTRYCYKKISTKRKCFNEW